MFQQSLGGNARTTVIICASPAAYNESETMSTLRFGIRAKTIKNVVSANVEVSAAEWRNRFNKMNTHMTKVKQLVLKLVKETRKWRDDKKPLKKEQVTLSMPHGYKPGMRRQGIVCCTTVTITLHIFVIGL